MMRPGRHLPRPDHYASFPASELLDDLGCETLSTVVGEIQEAARSEAAAKGRLLRNVALLYAKAMARRGEQAIAELRVITPWAFSEPGAIINGPCPPEIVADGAGDLGSLPWGNHTPAEQGDAATSGPFFDAEEDPSAPTAPAAADVNGENSPRFRRARVATALAQRSEDTVIRDVAAEIAVALMLAAGTARTVVEDALVLAGDLPAVLEAMERGDLTWANARVVLKHWRAMIEVMPMGPTDPLSQDPVGNDSACADAGTHPQSLLAVSPVEVWQSAQAVTEALVARSIEATPKQLDDLGHRLRAKLGRKADERAHAAARMHRAVWVTREEDGLAHLHALVDAAVARGIEDRLHRLSTAVEAQGRTHSEVRADVLGDLLLDGELPEGSGLPRGVRGQVSVLVPVQHLMPVPTASGSDTWPEGCRERDVAGDSGRGPGQERPTPNDAAGPARLEGFGPIAAAQARELAATAPTWKRLLTDAGTGVVLQHGRETYTVPEGLRRTLRLRDETCRFPGCRRPAGSSDLDHTVAWEDGGLTDAANLAHLCRHHHRIKHQADALGRWSVRQVQDALPGTLEWTSGTGIQRRTHPPGDLAWAAAVADDPPPF